MGFLKWHKNQDDSDSQMDLFGGLQKIVESKRVDGITVLNDFKDSIASKGGDGKTIARAINAETRALFDCEVDELYRETGGKKGDRSTLPKEAQKAYMVSETISTHRINGTEYKGSQKQKNDAMVEDVEDTAKEARGWFSW
jgi:hypothetical protein